MSRDPVVKGFRGAKFGDVDFSKYVTAWEDTRNRDGATHKYNKRDGGEGEDMGRASHRATVHLAYIGPSWLDDYLTLQAKIDDAPIDTLTHPVHGAMTAYARSVGARMDVENAPNLYEVTLSFEESSVGTKTVANAPTASQQGPAAKQQLVNAQITAVNSYSASFPSAQAAILAATAASSAYTAAAVTASSLLVSDATLTQQLANTLSLIDAASNAIAADPAAVPGFVDPAIGACELLFDAVAQMDDALKAVRPQLSAFTVPMTMHITALSQLLYGPVDGPTRESEILVNNPIPDPGMIPAGTVLQLAPKTT